MPNSIKYNASTQSQALKKGNFWIGTGDVGKGPSSSTGYFDGVTPGSNQYVIYYNKSGSNRIYYCSNGDQVYVITNRLKGQNLTTLESALTYIATQSDMMCTNINYEPIVTNGLVLNIDAGFTPSYPTSGTTWYDVGKTNNATLINGPTFNSSNGGSISFDGSDDFVTIADSSDFNFTNAVTIDFWVYVNSYGGGGTMFIHQQSGGGFGGFEIYSNTGGVILYNKNADASLVVAGGFTLNSWRNVVCTSDGTTNRIYLNGSTRAISSGGLPDNVNGQLRIGGWSGGGYLLNGRMPIMRMYNRALNAVEILQNYNAQKGRFGL